MFASLSKLVSGGYSFPYTLEEPYDTAWGKWTHYRGKSKEDGSPVSIFKISAADANDRSLICARNGVKRLKLLRHPNVLAFKDSSETTEKGATVIYLVTEPVKPLKLVLKELDLHGQHRDEYFAMGLLHMTNAVSFLNNDCKLIHGNICMACVVVTETLDFKLSGFDLLSEHSLPPDQALQNASWMVGDQYKCAELGKSEWSVIQQGPPWAVDAWGLGCLMQEVFSQEDMASVENLRRTNVIPPALLQDYQKLLSSAPSRRLNPSKVAQSKFLNNRLVDVVAFMENISLKDSVEKESFFRKLPNALPSIPPAVAIRKILPLLSSALEFGGAPPVAVSSLMVIGSQLEGEEFNKRVVPCLSKLFASTDRGLRRSLLESVDQYGPHLTTAVIEEQIYPQLQSGFTDGHGFIRELTLKSMLTLAPKMSNKTLVSSVLKHLSKLQVDEEPSIRANTTVLLGSIAPYLGDATCRRVLLNAFTRALKDLFPPARVAGLKALVASKQYYSAEDVAVRLLPSVCPLSIDPVPDVRQSALACLDTFVKVLAEEDARRAKEIMPPEPGSSAAGSAPATATSTAAMFGAQAGSAMVGATGTMLNWAVSSLMGPATTSAQPAQLATAGSGSVKSGVSAATPTAAAARSTAAPAAATATRSTSNSGAPPAGARTTSVASSSQAAGEGWGDGDGWDEEEIEVDEEELAARARLKALTKPAAPKPPPAKADALGSGSAVGSRFAYDEGLDATAAKGGWGDDDEDLSAWEGLEQSKVAAAPAAAARRPAARAAGAATRAASAAGATGAAAAAADKPKKLGAMKLGAAKLASGGGSSATGGSEDPDAW